MIELLQQFNKAFESKARLGIMSVLMVNESVDFSSLKELLQVTDGNLASHAKALEELKYIVVHKQFIGKKPNTTYTATELGKQAFINHLNSLEMLLKSNK
ncbi:winged helix-turn-helix domain-containing protein [Solitalea koreensis]|uniref:Transcriptional regulator n=1 Tax=Solitalea koreensis TaxID=543615 RepID=A0A521DRK9_9SPHI|nr:transcriptional regulator [Solitalea koreensis]SMO74373.1 transcriptional regulator [Solitalea koreensis]